MPSIQLTDVTLNYADVGAGPVLLLVHGFPLDHTMWQPQIDGLSDRFRVIAPDLRGFGKSSGGKDQVTMERFADDLADLLARLQCAEPIVFCGLSMGGYIAWQFWRRHADQLSHLILCDTRSIADPDDVARGRLETAKRVLNEDASIVAEAITPKLFAAKTYREQSAIVDATRRVMLATAPAAIAAALRGMAAREDMTSVLPQIDVPTLVICGEHDAISPSAEMRSIADSLPNARYVEVPNAGHMASMENPDHVNAAIREFLGADAPTAT